MYNFAGNADICSSASGESDAGHRFAADDKPSAVPNSPWPVHSDSRHSARSNSTVPTAVGDANVRHEPATTSVADAAELYVNDERISREHSVLRVHPTERAETPDAAAKRRRGRQSAASATVYRTRSTATAIIASSALSSAVPSESATAPDFPDLPDPVSASPGCTDVAEPHAVSPATWGTHAPVAAEPRTTPAAVRGPTAASDAWPTSNWSGLCAAEPGGPASGDADAERVHARA